MSDRLTLLPSAIRRHTGVEKTSVDNLRYFLLTFYFRNYVRTIGLNNRDSRVNGAVDILD